MDTGALISVIVLILFFSGIFIATISYEIWKVTKKNSSNKKYLLNEQDKQSSTSSINERKRKTKK